MEQEKTSTLFARYALPQMIGLVFNSVYTIVDGVFIGHRLGRQAMAAAAVSVPLIEILISLALAIGSGAAVMIASRLSRHEDSAARRIFVLAVWMTAGLGLFIAIGGNLFLQPLARLPELRPISWTSPAFISGILSRLLLFSCSAFF